MEPLGGRLDGLTDEELKDELEERDHAVGAMMEDLRDQMDYISHDLPLKATSSREFDQAVTDMDAVLEEIDGHLKDVDEIYNPSCWDAEPDGLKRQYGKRPRRSGRYTTRSWTMTMWRSRQEGMGHGERSVLRLRRLTVRATYEREMV